jgi:hypothetical protein
MKKIFALTAALAASASAFAFQAGMTIKAIDAEVDARISKGESLETIAAAAKDGGMLAGVITSSLVRNSSASIVSALTNAGFSGSEVVKAAVGNVEDRDKLILAAVVAGADPLSMFPPTAAGITENKATQPTQWFNAASFDALQPGNYTGL